MAEKLQTSGEVMGGKSTQAGPSPTKVNRHIEDKTIHRKGKIVTTEFEITFQCASETFT
jgi:hypothetical protein